MYQKQYCNIKYSHFINEFNKFVSSNFKIKNVNQSMIKNQLLFFINLSLKKGIPASYKLLQTNFLKKLLKLYYYFPNTVQDLLENIYNNFNFDMYCPNIFINHIMNLMEYGIEINFSMSRKKQNNIEILFDEILYLKTSWSYLLSKNTILNDDLNECLERYKEIILHYENFKNGFDEFTNDFFTTELFPLFEKLKNNLNKNTLSNNITSIKTNQESLKNILLKNRTYFYNNEKLAYGEDLYTEFKNYFFPLSNDKKEELKKQICAFLNSKGGRIYIGITDSKIVKGIFMDYKKRDWIRNEIINYTYDFYPKCRTNKIDITFIPIKDNDENYEKNLFVIKIIVHQGETDQLYSMTEKGFNAYIRLPGQCAYLTALEIKDEIIKRTNNPEKGLNDSEFQDPEPENPELNNKNNLISNKKNIIKTNKSNQKDIDKYYRNDYDDYYNYNYSSSSNDENSDEYSDEKSDDDNDYYYQNVNTKNSKNQYLKMNHYIVKINTFGNSPSCKKLAYMFQNVNYCKKKFLKKDRKIYGFLDFTDYNYAQNIVQQYNNCIYDGCGVKLSLQSTLDM